MGKYDWGKQRERVRKNASESNYGGSSKLNLPDGVEFFKPKKGVNEIDIIPYIVKDKNHLSGRHAPVGEPWYVKPIRVHFKIGIDEKPIICPTTIGKPCPICDERARLIKEYGRDNKKKHDHLRYKDRELYNVIDKKGDPDKILIWEIARFNFGKALMEEIKEQDSDEADSFYFPEGGSTLKVRFGEETTGENTYLKTARIDFLKRDEEYPESIVEEAYNFDDMLNVLSYEELQKLFLGIEETEEDAEEAPKPRKTPGAAPRSTKEPEDEEEPAPKSRGRRTPEPEEDEPKPKSRRQPEPEPEEDEAPAPRSRGRRQPEPEEEEETTPQSRRRASRAEPEPEPEEEDEEPKPKSRRQPEPEPEQEAEDDFVCPNPKGVFGKDAENLEECISCDIWADCMKAKKEMTKRSRRQ